MMMIMHDVVMRCCQTIHALQGTSQDTPQLYLYGLHFQSGCIVNSSNPIGLADRTRLLTSVMLAGPADAAAGRSGSVILQISQNVD